LAVVFLLSVSFFHRLSEKHLKFYNMILLMTYLMDYLARISFSQKQNILFSDNIQLANISKPKKKKKDKLMLKNSN
jgi:hypothetical protein